MSRELFPYRNKAILFLMLPSTGHLHLTFKMAKRLSQSGYIIYFAVTPDVEKMVSREGFNCIEMSIMPFVDLRAEMLAQKKNCLQLLIQNLMKRGHVKLKSKMLINDLISKVRSVKPEIVFLDTYCALMAPLLYDVSGRIISLNTQLKSFQRENNLPINSSLIPNASKEMFSLWVRVIWSIHFMKRFFRMRVLETIVFVGQNRYRILKELFAERKILIKEVINTSRFYYGIKGVKELSLIPDLFNFQSEFSEEPVNSITSMIDMDRHETFDNAYYLLRLKLKQIKESSEFKLIYCCLGTVSHYHSKHCISFFKRLMQACQGKNWILVISTGTSQNIQSLLSFSQHYSNVFISGYLPQLDLLGYSDVMINHGGINSVLECIGKEVPMLVYPLNSFFDQNGNAARVLFHGLGLRGNIKKDSVDLISNEIESLIVESIFKTNLKNFNQKISYEVDLGKLFSTNSLMKC